MTPVFRSLFAVMLALVLTLTAQSMALARGQTMVAGQMVLCTGAGVVTVQVDAEGNPVSPSHICPDCALNLLMAVAADPVEVLPHRVRETLAFRAALVRVGGVDSFAPKARGPPPRDLSKPV
ncbi:hypothetical protein [Primorskyibacter marinus]|uniref:hypothetical protein n=1 Tax=Primorskyibacter marinus TaxID=1977320 RepID=UPI000E30587B|nr:hypothetical protein [Primorskyibacter marinus]